STGEPVEPSRAGPGPSGSLPSRPIPNWRPSGLPALSQTPAVPRRPRGRTPRGGVCSLQVATWTGRGGGEPRGPGGGGGAGARGRGRRLRGLGGRCVLVVHPRFGSFDRSPRRGRGGGRRDRAGLGRNGRLARGQIGPRSRGPAQGQ